MPEEPSDNPTQDDKPDAQAEAPKQAESDNAPAEDKPTEAEPNKPAVKLSRKERKQQAKLNAKRERAKYDSWFAYKYHSTVDPYGSFKAWLWKGSVKPIGSVIIIVVLFRSTLLDWNDVPTGSMEPEIQVGDRIAVNRLAFGFQLPLTGPQIGIPFTPLQWDNPLDGIPQFTWGDGPARGDIVTFWNPVTKVRMVKRIVAIPGDTVSMTGGAMTINGTAAGYKDITPFPPRETKFKETSRISRKPKTVKKLLEDLEETLLDETRTVQHIKERWLHRFSIVENAEGQWRTVKGDTIIETVALPDPSNPQLLVPTQVRRTLEQYLDRNPTLTLAVRFENGTPTIDSEPVSFNRLTERLLAKYAAGAEAELLKKAGLTIDGHQLKIDGEAVPFEFFADAVDAAVKQMKDADKAKLKPVTDTLSILRQALMTNFGPVTLGDGEYYMVGDNRNNSHDSRYFGPVQRNEITGRAFAVAFSFKDNKMLTLPPIPAWSRFFKDLD